MVSLGVLIDIPIGFPVCVPIDPSPEQLLAFSKRLYDAAEAGIQAQRDMEETLGVVGECRSAFRSGFILHCTGDFPSADARDAQQNELLIATSQATAAARAAAVQAAEPWKGATLDDLEEPAISCVECFRIFAGLDVPSVVREDLKLGIEYLLVKSTLIEPSYR